MKGIRRLGNIVNSLSRLADWVARSTAFLMMALFCINILLRIIGRPFVGTYEIISFLGALTAAYALPYCCVNKGHIAVELIVDNLPDRFQAIIDTITGILSLGLFALITWKFFSYANELSHTHEITPTLKIPIFPFVYLVCLGFVIACMVLFIDTVKSIKKSLGARG